MNPMQSTRRAFLSRASLGLGSLALGNMIDPSVLSGATSGVSGLPHH